MVETASAQLLQRRKHLDQLSSASRRSIDLACAYFNPLSALLIGSTARGTATSSSDIDLLLLCKRPRSSTNLLRDAEFGAAERPVSVITYSPSSFRKFWREGSLFVHHALTEGVVLFDNGPLADLLKTPFRLKSDFSSDINEQLERVQLFANLEGFSGGHALVAARLYSIYKNVAFFALAQAGSPCFDKREAFSDFFTRFQDLKGHRRMITRLYACYRLVTNRRPTPAKGTVPTDFELGVFVSYFSQLRARFA
jgi:hypothetical protein